MNQRTLATSIFAKGKVGGLKDEVLFSLNPAPVNNGVTIRRTDISPHYEFQVGETVDTDDFDSLSLRNLVATLHAVGVDNVIIDVFGATLPPMCGAAKTYIFLIESAGIVEQSHKREYFEIIEELSLEQDKTRIRLLPSDNLRITCFSKQDIKPENRSAAYQIVEISQSLFRSQLCRARQLNVLQKALNQKNLTAHQVEQLQREVRSRCLLDLLGILAMLGAPLKAHYIGFNVDQRVSCLLVDLLTSSQLSVRYPVSLQKTFVDITNLGVKTSKREQAAV